MDLARMKKSELINVLAGSLEGDVVWALPEWAEMTPGVSVSARQLLRLARGIDEGEELATAAHHKQFRELWAEVMADGDGDDDSRAFWQRMQAEMGNGED